MNAPTRAPDRFALLAVARPCRDCHLPIMWVTDVDSGDLVPVDATATTGRQADRIAWRDEGQRRAPVVSRRVTRPVQLPGLRADGWATYQPHRITCAKADEWSRLPKHRRPTPTTNPARPDPVDTQDPQGMLL